MTDQEKKEKQRASKRKWASENPEKVRAAIHKWHSENLEKGRVAARKYRDAHPDKVRESQRKYLAANLDKQHKRQSKYRTENKEKTHAAVRKWQLENPEKSRESTRKWQSENPKKVLERVSRRRARKHDATIGEVNLTSIWNRDKGICYLCGNTIDPSAVHFDHVIPLSKGGAHSADNLRPTHPKCNLSKGAKTVDINKSSFWKQLRFWEQ